MDVTPKKRKSKKIKTRTETIYNPTVKVPEQQIVTAKNFYNMGMGAEFTSKQPNTPGRDSCFKLWRFWDGQLRDEYEMDTNERQINQKQRMNESFERMLLKLEIKLAKYETTMQSEYNAWQETARKAEADGTIPPSFKINRAIEMDHLRIIELILETRDAMTGLAFTPTINEHDEATILKRMQAKADRLAEIDAQFRDKEAILRDHARK